MAALIIVVVLKFRDSAVRSKNSNPGKTSNNKDDRMSPTGGASSVGTSANLPLRADVDDDGVGSAAYGLADMTKAGVDTLSGGFTSCSVLLSRSRKYINDETEASTI